MVTSQSELANQKATEHLLRGAKKTLACILPYQRQFGCCVSYLKEESCSQGERVEVCVVVEMFLNVLDCGDGKILVAWIRFTSQYFQRKFFSSSLWFSQAPCVDRKYCPLNLNWWLIFINNHYFIFESRFWFFAYLQFSTKQSWRPNHELQLNDPHLCQDQSNGVKKLKKVRFVFSNVEFIVQSADHASSKFERTTGTVYLLLWRANARNVSQQTLYGVQHIHINLTLIHYRFDNDAPNPPKKKCSRSTPLFNTLSLHQPLTSAFSVFLYSDFVSSSAYRFQIAGYRDLIEYLDVKKSDPVSISIYCRGTGSLDP